MPIAITPPSFTVWSYDYDSAPFHANDLRHDTYERRDIAVQVARQRVRETSQNTGWAKIIDNNQAGRLGDNGVIIVLKKTPAGRVHITYTRERSQQRITMSKTHTCSEHILLEMSASGPASYGHLNRECAIQCVPYSPDEFRDALKQLEAQGQVVYVQEDDCYDFPESYYTSATPDKGRTS